MVQLYVVYKRLTFVSKTQVEIKRLEKVFYANNNQRGLGLLYYLTK